MKILLIALSALLSGCATSEFVHSEPNPDAPRPGFGYVDFLYLDKDSAPCKWQVYQKHQGSTIWGGATTIEERVDDHVYLAEIAAKTHRLVRVESKPGRQQFRVNCVSDAGSYFTVEVKESMVVPVQLSARQSRESGTLSPMLGATSLFEAGLNSLQDRSYTNLVTTYTASVKQPIQYKKKEKMPYFKP